MSVSFELKISPFEAEKMFFDRIDHLGILGYYDEILKSIKELEKQKVNNG